jgi:4-hydroxybenzoate polyprenyltransferase and relat ed prenyltransferases
MKLSNSITSWDVLRKIEDVKIFPMFIALLKSLRLKQWIKNLLIFIPLIFSREFLNPESAKIVLAAFGIFSLTTSGIYLINDVLDRELDQKHHTKKKRPIASGKLSSRAAVLSALLLFLASFFFAWHLNCWLLDVLVIYIMLQLTYSGILKHIAIIDLFAIAAGFVLRVFAGALVIDVEVSGWLLAVTFLLALLLAAGKRLREIEQVGMFSRKVLKSYSPEFLKM